MDWPASARPAHHYVAIGASGGEGLHDIRALLRALPHPLAAVVMVVLHRPVDRISHLRATLAAATPAPVIIAREGERLEAGRVYIGEPAHHLTLIGDGAAGLVPGPGNEHRNRTVDLLFRSLAARAGPSVIGVVLSGSLDDGSRGLAAIHAAGGVTMVLTPDRGGDRCGMPENAIGYDGPIDVIGSPGAIAREITRRLASFPCATE
jgi:two-component system, chemotaxis family, protein-glutamate methylesterase/glutaminase